MTYQTCTGDDAFSITNGVISSVIAGFTCVSISERIVSIKDGSPTDYVFMHDIDYVEKVDFSKAINLISIGSLAFYNCQKIKEIDLSQCSKINSIGMFCFYYCTSLKSIKLPEVCNIKRLTSGCFSYSGITSFIIPNNVEILEGVYAPIDCNVGVFGSCRSLSEIIFQKESKVKSIGVKVFVYTNLTTITFPASLTSLAYETFRVCNNLKSINVDAGNPVFSSKNGVLLKNNGKRIFYYPNKAVEGNTIQIPEGVTSIGTSAFIGDKYKYINMTGITEICGSGFDRLNILINITIPASVTVLNKNVFYQCSSLKNIVLEGKYEALPDNFFRQCTSLASFSVPSGIKTIGNYTFYGCSGLVKVFIPKTVTMIGTGSFSSCHPQLVLEFEEGSPISYTTNGYLYNSDKSRLIIYLGQSNSVIIISSVKTICIGAFREKSITDVTFEAKENITSIENEVFRECKSLTTITLPPNIELIPYELFYSCSGLTSISIPSKVKTIEDNAFWNCSQLKSITFSSQLWKIGIEAFYFCTSLKDFKLPDSVTAIYKNAFRNSGIETFYVPANLGTIQESAFSSSSLKRIEFPKESTYFNIGRLSFDEAINLESVAFPDYIQIIRESAFSSCTKLKNVTIGKYVSVIENNAFIGCTSLEKVIIYDNLELESISSISFEGCTNLREFDVDDGNNNFYFATGILFNKNQTDIIIFLRATNERFIEIPNKVKTVRSYAFSNSHSIETVTFNGAGIEKISPNAFYQCKSLRSVNFPSSLLSIGSSAFNGCALKSINIGEALNITSLPDHVFANNKKLGQVIFPNTIEEISGSAFENAGKKAIVVYLGPRVIKNKVGFSSSSRVIASDQYKNDYFVGILVIRNMKQLCTIKPKYLSTVSIVKQMAIVSLIIISSA